MNKKAFEGTGVALVTPFSGDGSIDFPSLKKVLDHTGRHVDYFVVLGTTGESVTLAKKEKKQVVGFILQNNTFKKPIVLGIGGNNTTEILETISETDFNGISAILSVSPYYNKPTQEGIYQHYIAIADKCPVPVIIYNVPGRTASNISAATTLRLAKHKNIIGTKEASGDLMQCMDIAAGKPADFLLISGDDMLTVPMISIGARGVISVLANVLPEEFCAMINAGLASDFSKASELAYRLLPVNAQMYKEGNPVGVKAAMELKGICNSDVRLPLMKASEQLKGEIKKAL